MRSPVNMLPLILTTSNSAMRLLGCRGADASRPARCEAARERWVCTFRSHEAGLKPIQHESCLRICKAM